MRELAAVSAGCVLVVEDEAIIAAHVAGVLDEMGLRVIGPAQSVGAALDAIETDQFDCALVDMLLCGQSADPVVDALRARSIPFAFATGAMTVPERKNGPVARILEKPFNTIELEDVVRSLLPDRSLTPVSA